MLPFQISAITLLLLWCTNECWSLPPTADPPSSQPAAKEEQQVSVKEQDPTLTERTLFRSIFRGSRGLGRRSPAAPKGKKTSSEKKDNKKSKKAAEEFADKTQAKGKKASKKGVVFESEEGDEFEADFDVRLSRSGIVSLAAAAESVDSVACSRNEDDIASVSIDLDSEVLSAATSLTQLFPVGAVLVITSRVFGPCQLGEPVVSDLNALPEEGSDGFLIIESAESGAGGVTIRGKSTSFFNMYEEATINILRLGSESRRRSRKLATTIELSETFADGIFETKASAKFNDNSGFELLSADWDTSGLNLELRTVTDYSIELEVETILKIGLLAKSREFDFISVPIFAVPQISLGFVDLELPDLRLGGYFEAPILLSIDASLQKKFGALGKATFSSGREETSYFARGPWTDIDIGTEVVASTPPTTTYSILPTEDLTGEPVTLEVTVFLGLQPRLAIYLPLFTTRASLDMGFEAKSKLALVGEPFKPLPEEVVGAAAQFGTCQECHTAEVDLSFKIANAGVSGVIGMLIEIDVFGYEITILEERSFEAPYPGNPSLTEKLAIVCLFQDEDYDVCINVCCEKDEDGESECSEDTSMDPPTGECKGEPSASPTLFPTQTPEPSTTEPSPTPTPPPTPPTPTPPPPTPPSRPPGRSGSSNGDPHMATFDGLGYDCQGEGEFVLVKDLVAGSSLEIQARFRPPSSNSRVTVTTGVVAMVEGGPRIQVSYPASASPDDSCPLLLFVDGEQRTLQAGSIADGKVNIDISGDTTEVRFSASNVIITMRQWASGTFGCGLHTIVFLPDEFAAGRDLVGLLGSIDNDPTNDWMQTDGVALTFPDSYASRYGQVAYEYCTMYWCLRDPTDSLFTYEEMASFEFFSNCDQDYIGGVDLDMASQELRDLCGNDIACLIDGILGDLADAQQTLDAQAVVDEDRAQLSPFQFDPSVVRTGVSVSILISIDLRGDDDIPAGLEHFDIYRVNPESGEQDGTIIVMLMDNLEEGLFSSELALASDVAGEVFGFRAVPSIDGTPDPNSSLVFTAISAVRSYSDDSGIGGDEDGGGTITVASLEDTNLIVQYSWPADQNDLDTQTSFLDGSVGFGCFPSNPYLEFSGDNTGLGGEEVVTVKVGLALDDEAIALDAAVDVGLFAGWYSSAGGSGPALVCTYLVDETSGLEIPETRLVLPVDPGTQSGCSSTAVGKVEIVISAAEASVTLSALNLLPPS